MAVKSFHQTVESNCDSRHQVTRCHRSNSSLKQVTPFSIDDILSRREDNAEKNPLLAMQQDSFNEALLCPNKPLWATGDFLPWSTGIYPKWLENLRRLYATHLQPFLLPVNLARPPLSSHLSAWCPGSRQSLNDNFDPWNSKRRKLSADFSVPNAGRRRASCSPRHSDEPRVKRRADVSKNGVSSMDESSSDGEEVPRPTNKDAADEPKDMSTESDSPIHALEKLACSTFKGMEEKQSMLHSIAIGRQARVKRRKCRTAFTSFQLSVLEQRFSCHKYLTPSDRDQIAQALGLTAPQVITWFQNRRAKLKRDMEEMRNDLKTVNPYSEADEVISEPCENAAVNGNASLS